MPAGFMRLDSLIVDFWPSRLSPVVIYEHQKVNFKTMKYKLHSSLGKTPSAIVFTRTLISLKVAASIRPRWIVAVLLEAYANWPLLLLFIKPEMDATLIMLEL